MGRSYLLGRWSWLVLAWSVMRARIEQVFAEKGGWGLFVRTIGLARAITNIVAVHAYETPRLDHATAAKPSWSARTWAGVR